MQKAKIAIALGLIVSTVTAEATPLACHHVFRPETREWTAIHSIQLMTRIAADSKLRASKDVDTMTKILFGGMGRRLRPEVLRRQGADFEGIVNSFEKALRREKGVSELMHLKVGLPKGEPAIQWATRQIMQKGLTDFIANLEPGVVHRQTLRDRLRIQVGRIVDHPMIHRISLATRQYAPVVANHRDVDLPTDLMTKIITDGVDAHKAEIEAVHAASGQKKIDVYRTAQRAVGAATVMIAAFVVVQQYLDFDVIVQPDDGEEPQSQTATVADADPSVTSDSGAQTTVTEEEVETEPGQSIEDLANAITNAGSRK